MIKIILLILIFLPLTSWSEVYNYKILRIVDGDTIEIEAPYLPKPLKPEILLRISGIDTPEKEFRANCEMEAGLGQYASEYTQQLINQAKEKTIIITGEDKYFRLLGDVMLDGKSLRESLLEKGYARPYYGSKKPSWCD